MSYNFGELWGAWVYPAVKNVQTMCVNVYKFYPKKRNKNRLFGGVENTRCYNDDNC